MLDSDRADTTAAGRQPQISLPTHAPLDSAPSGSERIQQGEGCSVDDAVNDTPEVMVRTYVRIRESGW